MRTKQTFFLAAHEHKHQVVRSCDINTVCTCSAKVVVGTGMVEEHASFESQMTLYYTAPLSDPCTILETQLHLRCRQPWLPSRKAIWSRLRTDYQLYSQCIKQWQLNKNIIIGYIVCDCDRRVVSYTMYWSTTRAFPEAVLMHRYCHEDSVDI